MIMSDLFFSEQILRDKEGTLTVTLLCRREVTTTAGNARARTRATEATPSALACNRSNFAPGPILLNEYGVLIACK